MPRTPKRVELFKGAYSGREYPRVWTLFKSRTLKLREFFRDGAALLHVQQDTFAGTTLNLLHCRYGVKFQFGRQGGAQAPSLVYTYCSSITSNGISTSGRKWLPISHPFSATCKCETFNNSDNAIYNQTTHAIYREGSVPCFCWIQGYFQWN